MLNKQIISLVIYTRNNKKPYLIKMLQDLKNKKERLNA